MPEPAGTLELIARELATALQPLEDRLAAGNAEGLLVELGIQLPGGVAGAATATATVAVKAGELAPLIVALTDAIEAEDAGRIASSGLALLNKIKEVVDAIGALKPAFATAVAAAGGLTPAQRAHVQAEVSELPARLLEHLVIEYLRVKGPGAVDGLRIARVIDEVAVPGVPGDLTAPPFTRVSLRLDRGITALTHPADYLQEAFAFGAPGFDGLELFTRVASFLDDRDVAVTLLTPPGQPPILEAYLLRLGIDPGTSPPSLTARLRWPATQDWTRTYPLSGPWSLVLDAKARFDAGLEATVTPPFALTITPPSGAASIDASGSLQASKPGDLLLLLGQAGASRMEARSISVGAGLKASATSGGHITVEPTARAAFEGGHILIDLASGDGFISAIAGGAKIDSNFDLRALWAPSTGLQLEGSAALEIAIPTHVRVGPIDIRTIYLRSGIAADGSLPTELSGSFAASLGPIEAVVDRIGINVITRFPAGGGNLGPVDIGFAFKAPNGVGLSVDAGVVKGGGYLFIDAERGEYAGVLELDFTGIVALKAIGLITTKKPDGSPGFSLLIIITAEFATGIQLGFGFTLLAVGGVLGLNRAMNLQALTEGIRSNAISSVMFPHDVVANAPQIISDLRTFFPPQDGTFVIGPMAKLGWGTPTLVSLSLGVIIEIPGNIAIVGVLKIALPAEEIGLIVLQVNFIGAIEFDRSRFYFFASIYDSHILFLTIEGEMAVLAAFGDDANFVLSVGGFHPSFDPPPLPVPVPKRIAVDILNNPLQKLRVEAYFAVTTNTAQFGARVDLRYGLSDCGIEGSLAFDALLQFSPLHFVVDISASISLKVFGIGLFSVRLHLELSGPSPWRAKGSASLSLFFFDIDVDFDVTWGEARESQLPPIDVMPLIKGEYDKPESWTAQLPSGNRLLVSLRALDPAVDTLVLHPVGVLRVTQRAVPLDLTLDKVGNQKPTDVKKLTLGVATGGLAKRGDVQERFAPAQFQEFGDAEKLAKPAYQDMHGGIDLSVSGDQLTSGAMVKRVIRYELITIDGAFRNHQRFFVLPFLLLDHWFAGSAVALSTLSKAAQQQYVPFEDKVAVTGDAYVVANQADNTVVASFATEAAAAEHLSVQMAGSPSFAATLHVIPAFEAVA